MAIKTYRPYTPSRRWMTGLTFEELKEWVGKKDGRPEKSLVRSLFKHSGRNSAGRITVRHRGGASTRKYRIIDFGRDKLDIPARVDTIEYDPNRSARIALLVYADGEKRYMLAPLGLKVGDTVISSRGTVDVRAGNALLLENVPLGTLVHNVELYPGRGGQLVRAAGSAAQVLAKEGTFVTLRLPSGEMRLIRNDCMVTIGQVGNPDHANVKLGKAGRKRRMGWRPEVRGSAMSPRDHPHGGGEGRTPVGMSGPKSPWGWRTMGRKTRRNKATDKYIVRRSRAGRR